MDTKKRLSKSGGKPQKEQQAAAEGLRHPFACGLIVFTLIIAYFHKLSISSQYGAGQDGRDRAVKRTLMDRRVEA